MLELRSIIPQEKVQSQEKTHFYQTSLFTKPVAHKLCPTSLPHRKKSSQNLSWSVITFCTQNGFKATKITYLKPRDRWTEEEENTDHKGPADFDCQVHVALEAKYTQKSQTINFCAFTITTSFKFCTIWRTKQPSYSLVTRYDPSDKVELSKQIIQTRP